MNISERQVQHASFEMNFQVNFLPFVDFNAESKLDYATMKRSGFTNPFATFKSSIYKRVRKTEQIGG